MVTFNPRDGETLQCPFGAYQELRSTSPVHRDPASGWWFVSRNSDVESVLRAPARFSSRVGHLLRPVPEPELAERIAKARAPGWPEVPVLVTEDPPVHRAQRTLVQKAFSPRRVTSMVGDITEVARALVMELPTDEPFDFVADLAVPFPLLVIAAALGIPEERQADFKRWADNRIRMIGSQLSDDVHVEIAESEVERQRFFHAAFADRRTDPRDDLMTDLVNARLTDEDGRGLSDEELMSMIGQVLSAGIESTTKVLAEIVHQMSTQPELWDWLRADPENRAPVLAKEGVRMTSPFQVLLRVATEEAEIAGQPIPAGDIVALLIGSAARDERIFADAERFTPRQGPGDSLAFGSGIHRCLGANLASRELEVMLQMLASRFTTLSPATDSLPAYGPSFMIRGINELRLIGRPG